MSMSRNGLSSRLGVMLTILLLSACGGETSQGESPVSQPTPTPTVSCSVQSLTIKMPQQRIQAGETAQLSAAVTVGPAGCTTTVTAPPVIWLSRDPGVLVVDAQGKVSGLKPGSATVVATSGGVEATLTLSVTPASAAASALRISEAGEGWVELHNTGTQPERLADYRLRSGSFVLRSESKYDFEDYVWSLPDITLPAGGYYLLRGVYVKFGQPPVIHAPAQRWAELGLSGRQFWLSSEYGYLDLTLQNKSVDFIRWGRATEVPTTPGVGTFSSLTFPDAGSVVRTAPSSLQASHFPTPAGPNDVPLQATDDDKDGIPDTAEFPGGSFAGLDLYAMGARAGVKDIFVELDVMNSSSPSIDLSAELLQKMVTTFRQHGYALHLDRGNRFTNRLDPAQFNLGNEQNTVPYTSTLTLTPKNGSAADLHTLKVESFDPRRLTIFHYGIIGSRDPEGWSGWGEYSNDFVVTAERFSPAFALAAMMHELGHNLGLRHGGFEDVNYKPNYSSIMNYRHDSCVQLSPTGQNCVLDYSDGTSKPLDEAHLNEQDGWGRQPFFMDWNKDGAVQTDLRLDINGDKSISVLKDFNDWANLRLDFARQSVALGQLNTPSPTTPAPIIANDQQPATH